MPDSERGAHASERPRARAKLRELLRTAGAGERTLLMGVLNVTPDSFSDGGRFFDRVAALEHALRCAEEGADILDVGGESTRPATFRAGQWPGARDEQERVLPVIAAIAERLPEMPISIDTYRAATARAALDVGAVMINDISALRADPEMADTVARSGATVCLMHLPGLPGDLPVKPDYGDDVVETVRRHLEERAAAACAAGVAPEDILLDPGFGFGKSLDQNLELLRRLHRLCASGYPVLVGTSRKSMIGAVLGALSPDDRMEGTAATVALAIAQGASVVRVHDVRQMVRVARMADAVVRGGRPRPPEDE